MATTIAPPRRLPSPPVSIQTLEPSDVARLRLPGQRGARALRHELEQYPGRSVWAPSTLEFAIVGPWRNRPEIGCVNELVAVRQAEPLLRAAFERCVSHGDDLLLALELEAQRTPTRFERAGMDLLEEVITYEMPTPRETRQPRPSTRYIPVRAGDVGAIEIVAAIDRAAFPWLWQNSRAEFDVYLRTPGVEVALIEVDGQAIGYTGVTLFTGWGHLDRIAVAPDWQARGFGLEALWCAVDAMRQRGARRIGLSTQRTNRRSQRLYERFGFRRTYDHDYRLFGRWTHPESDTGPASTGRGTTRRVESPSAVTSVRKGSSTRYG
jgi:ribosomal protein S18 acetylase RimI-like enzyme